MKTFSNKVQYWLYFGGYLMSTAYESNLCVCVHTFEPRFRVFYGSCINIGWGENLHFQ